MKIITILGTRPEIIKLSPLIPLLDKEFEHILIHTGQHYDYNMDKVFFEQLHLLEPKYQLNVGSHLQGKQAGIMLEKIEGVLLQEKPRLVIVQGDTNTTMAGALAASKLHLPVLHLEAGCRSFNRKMPEEINRIIADHIADYCIAPDEKSQQNLLREGINQEKIFQLGSTAFDAVERNKAFTQERILPELNIEQEGFILVTLHRAENTNDINTLRNIIAALNQIPKNVPVIFPVHPRTKKVFSESNIECSENIKIVEPQPYLSFLALLSNCKFCITDSGGIQEEALAFNVPCVIPRNETEWTRLVEAGKNFLAGTSTETVLGVVNKLLDRTELQRIKEINYPFDTRVAEKIVQVIKNMNVNEDGERNKDEGKNGDSDDNMNRGNKE